MKKGYLILIPAFLVTTCIVAAAPGSSKKLDPCNIEGNGSIEGRVVGLHRNEVGGMGVEVQAGGCNVYLEGRVQDVDTLQPNSRYVFSIRGGRLVSSSPSTDGEVDRTYTTLPSLWTARYSPDSSAVMVYRTANEGIYFMTDRDGARSFFWCSRARVTIGSTTGLLKKVEAE